MLHKAGMGLPFFVGVIFFDQITKWTAVRQGLATVNTGISFGLFSLLPSWLLLLLVGIAALVLIRMGMRTKQPNWWWGLAAASVSSNVIDRIRVGGVIDWLPLPLLNAQNNSADWILFFCLFWLFIKEYRTIRT